MCLFLRVLYPFFGVVSRGNHKKNPPMYGSPILAHAMTIERAAERPRPGASLRPREGLAWPKGADMALRE